MKKKVKLIAIILFFVIISALAAVFIIHANNHNHKIIKVSGNIEGNDVRISFRIDGQIEELLADEGILLKAGQIVARLNKDELSKVQAQAAAALKYAQYQYKLDHDDYLRAENLFKVGAISAQQRDAAKTKSDTDKANIDQLKASLELANTKLGWADLASPLNGFVLVKSALQGEVVQAGAPVFTAVDLNDIWVTAYINENDLGKVKLGQKAYVQTDSYKGKKYDGWISFLSNQAEFTPKYIQTTEERVKYVYRLKVRVDNSSLDLKPGMPADAYIMID
ncbi:MAG: efflux RND transporter periplasmic adaptor subunit [Candidatus Omnitrophica bacterium]|nr:efflux RND transporter periplasmic adaptor subunit [Candidatus Omnitrophota bacterium]